MKTPDSMVVAWMSSQGVDQFVGYTVPTWYGRGGWGTLELFQDFAGQITLAEAFYLNNQRIISKLLDEYPEIAGLALDASSMSLMAGERRGPPTPALREMSEKLNSLDEKKKKEAIGHLYDRDAVAFYGDPKWEARADGTKTARQVEWKWSGTSDRPVLTLSSADGYKSDKLLILLPHRLRHGRVLADAGQSVVLNDEFVMFKQLTVKAGESLRIELGHPAESAGG
jgi:zinc protease